MIKRKLHTLITHFILLCTFASEGLSITLSPIALERGYAKIKVVSEFNLSTYTISKEQEKNQIDSFCTKLAKEFKRWNPSNLAEKL